MLTYSLDKKKKAPLYEQLYDCIRLDITQGKISGGEKLPSKRALAEHLGISKVTVEAAYAQLAAEGFIYSVEKKGYYAETVAQMPAAVPITEKADLQPDLISADICSNTVEPDSFPVSSWSKLMRATLLDGGSKLFSAAPYNGVLPLREAICKYLADNRGMSVSPSQLIIGAGTEYLYGLIVQLLGNDKVFAIENPSYGKIPEVYTAHGASCVFVDMDKNGVNISELDSKGAQVVHISPAHHFPTGTVTSQKRRFELLEWTNAAEGRYIIEDEYDSEFRFAGRPIPPIQASDADGRVIYINTFSKTISPSVRISYMILPPTLSEKFVERLGFYSCTVASFEQYTLARFIENGGFERHIRRMKRQYKMLRNDLILQIRSSPIADRAEIIEQDSGLHFILKIDTEVNDTLLKKACADRGARLSFLSEYYKGRNGPEHMMLVNYSGITREKFSFVLEILNESLEKCESMCYKCTKATDT